MNFGEEILWKIRIISGKTDLNEVDRVVIQKDKKKTLYLYVNVCDYSLTENNN